MKEVSSVDGISSPEKNKVEGGTLYLVGTPIGNMADISGRAVKVLKEVDFVAAEDTRNTGRLLQAIGSDRPMISYFEHNKKSKGEVIAGRLQAGESCALVTDAGMPGISDPGEDMVRLCAERGVPVTSVPGPCAAIDALVLSALPAGRFSFEGFLPTVKSERAKRLDEVKYDRRTLIFYEAPHRLRETLSALRDALGNRRISLCRELTKLNEEIFRSDLDGAVERYVESDPRGEYVLVVDGASEERPAEDRWWAGLTVPEHVEGYVSRGASKNEAIRMTALDLGLSKNHVYKLVLAADGK